jgi:hypothetical protein
MITYAVFVVCETPMKAAPAAGKGCLRLRSVSLRNSRLPRNLGTLVILAGGLIDSNYWG